MQNAPSVVYPVGRSVVFLSVGVGLGILGASAMVLGLWTAVQQPPGSQILWERWVVGAVMWCLWLMAAVWHWMNPSLGKLQWDAQAAPAELTGSPGAWQWCAPGQGQTSVLVHPETVFDGQLAMLLRLRGPWRRGLWVWMERAADPARWDDLRRALAWGQPS